MGSTGYIFALHRAWRRSNTARSACQCLWAAWYSSVNARWGDGTALGDSCTTCSLLGHLWHLTIFLIRERPIIVSWVSETLEPGQYLGIRAELSKAYWSAYRCHKLSLDQNDLFYSFVIFKAGKKVSFYNTMEWLLTLLCAASKFMVTYFSNSSNLPPTFTRM